MRLALTPHALAHLFAALGLALGATGCCEIIHLGWARSYGPSSWRELHPMPGALAATARVASDGTYDAETCARVCPAHDPVEITSCYPSTVDVPLRDDRIVTCKRMGGDERRRVPRAAVDHVPLDDARRLPDAMCPELCPPTSSELYACELERDLPPAPPVGTPFVVCELYEPGGCGDAVLSQRAAPPETATDRATNGATTEPP